MSTVRIATRNSPLAIWQANYVKDRLLEFHDDLTVEIVGMTTKGDQMLDRSLSKAGGKGLFLKELEVSLLENQTDIAVHSMKDVPVNIPEGLQVAVVCEREDPRDVVVSDKFQNLYALPNGARVGTSSMRRIAQLKSAFPALEFIELRGNVNTRLAKLEAGDYDAIILAAAGLIRLGLEGRISQYITPELCLPAVGQGIVGIECRSDDEQVQTILKPLHNVESALYLAAERSMNEALGGGCHVPIAGYAEVAKGRIRMRGMVGEVDGSRCLFSNRTSSSMSEKSAVDLGIQVAEDLLEQGAGDILDAVYSASIQSKQPSKPLVLLTRQESYLGNLVDVLGSFDFKAMHTPTLSIQETPETARLLEDLSDCTDLVFVSRNAVEIGMKVIDQHGGIPDHVRVMAVGAETAKQLYKEHKVDALFPGKGVGAEALLRVKSLSDLSGRRIFIVRGDTGLDWPAEEMRSRGAEVEQVVCYRQQPHEDIESQIQSLVAAERKIMSIFVHSAQSCIYLMEAIKPHRSLFEETLLVAGSQRIATTALDAGWVGQIRVAKSPSNKHMLTGLIS